MHTTVISYGQLKTHHGEAAILKLTEGHEVELLLTIKLKGGLKVKGVPVVVTGGTVLVGDETHHLHSADGEEDLGNSLGTLSSHLGESIKALGSAEGGIWELVHGLYEQTKGLQW